MKTDLNELINGWREDTLSDDEMRMLTDSLSTKEGRATLRGDWLLDAALPGALRTAPVLKSPTVNLWRQWRPLAAAAACVLLVCVISLLVVRQRGSDAVLSFEGNGVTVIRGDRSLPPSTTALREQDLVVAGNGGPPVALLLDRGATRLTLQAGVRLRLLALAPQKVFQLDIGSLRAEVAKQAPQTPMLIQTPHAEVRVLGTVFSLTAREDETGLTVESGVVRISQPDGSAEDVKAGQSAVASKQAPVHLVLAQAPAAKVQAPPAPPAAPATTITPWEKIRAVPMLGGLKMFWNVGGVSRDSNMAQAKAHGMELVDLHLTYADYAGEQKQNIRTWLDADPAHRRNPWNKPSFFEPVIKRNIRDKASQGSIAVHDIEFTFEQDPAKAWADPAVRAASGASTLEAFSEAYFREWATWFSLPCDWSKQHNPALPVGIYGAQPFRRDYRGISGKNAGQIDGTHQSDALWWADMDAHVDFYVASIYVFYEDPGSVYYMAANVEENFERTRRYGAKPVYAYGWMRYHQSNKKLGYQELAPWLAEAMAVVPYFCGARGIVLWGREVRVKDQPYARLPVFMDSLARIADLSEKIAKAEPVNEERVHVAWKEKRPLVRKLKVSPTEWIVLATNPWQADTEEKTITVQLGKDGPQVNLTLHGRHTEIFHIEGDRVTRH
jgi:FecR-like protein